jgi:glycosyltransferase involved in cell wall biosynthesis
VGIVTALAELADVDVFTVVPAGTEGAAAPSDAPMTRLAAAPTTPRGGVPAARLARWLLSRRPRSLLWRDWTAPRAALREWAGRDYDVVWFSHATSYLAFRDLLPGPHIVDLDNLTSSTLRHRRATQLRNGFAIRMPTVLARGAADTIDARRWRQAETEIAARAEAVVVCSELDRARLGQRNTWVVPNGYEPRFAGRPESADQSSRPASEGSGGPPVLLMVGLLRYEPNRDGATYFARRVLPLVRETLPDAELRVVGHYDTREQIAGLLGAPGVVITGEVPDLTELMLASDVAVVPIRFGGGTRIKILEAFAWSVPVVSTSVGAEGLDVVDGKHLLIADDPRSMSQACLRILTDRQLAARLRAAGRELWAERYTWAKVSEDVRSTVSAVVAAERT